MQIGKRKWVCFFSHSGQEIFNIMSFFGRKPDAIITNRQNDEGVFLPLHQDKNNLNWVTLPKKPTPDDYLKVLSKYKNPIITLHGYMRIIPKEVCKKYEIYNLHPGLITEYPDLKGADPQDRAIKKEYPRVGCVIHRVIPEVDEGEILASGALDATIHKDEEKLKLCLRSLATVMWYDFFNNYKTYEYENTK